jgi:hypothetical protein
MDPDQEGNMARAAQLLGFDNVDELQRAQHEWEEEYAQSVEDTEELREAIREGRYQGYENIAQMAADFPMPTEEEFEAERETQFAALLEEIQLAREREEQQILQTAQVMGTNPAGALGRLGEATALQEAQAQTNATLRALGIQQSRVGTAAQGLGGLQSALNMPLQLAGQTAGLATAGMESLGSLAARQMDAYNQRFMTMLGADYNLSTIPFDYMRGLNEAQFYSTAGETLANMWQQIGAAVGDIGGGQGGTQAPSSVPSTLSPAPSAAAQFGPAVGGRGWPGYAASFGPSAPYWR